MLVRAKPGCEGNEIIKIIIVVGVSPLYTLANYLTQQFLADLRCGSGGSSFNDDFKAIFLAS